jgi:hypothetical protein
MIRKSKPIDAYEAYGIRRRRLPMAKDEPMRQVTIKRDKSEPTGTFGVLKAGLFSCYSLELADHENAVGVSCIPAGTYRAEIHESPKFGKVYRLKDVPGRADILIHRGNFAASEGHGKTDVEGCILLGNAVGEIAGQKALLSSKDSVERFMAEMEGEPFDLVITWA